VTGREVEANSEWILNTPPIKIKVSTQSSQEAVKKKKNILSINK
jgi:hypothetical protein